MVKQVNICTEGECGGECYRCRLRDYQKQSESAIKFLIGLLDGTGQFDPWHELWDSEKSEVKFIREIAFPQWNR